MKAARAIINNDLYEEAGNDWWNPEEVLNLLESVMNPGRVGYFNRIIQEELHLPTHKMRALEVGCGGGVLCEQVARMGFETTGIDPAPTAISVAQQHASQSGLKINYLNGYAEKLPFTNAQFDAVFCCDVLEHVRDVEKAVSEISRVLKPGGYFFYDTINRTLVSKLVTINVFQEWEAFSFLPKGVHVWEKFIKPSELYETLAKNGLENLHSAGLAPKTNPLVLLYKLYQRNKGKVTFRQITPDLRMSECKDLSASYMGYAKKR